MAASFRLLAAAPAIRVLRLLLQLLQSCRGGTMLAHPGANRTSLPRLYPHGVERRLEDLATVRWRRRPAPRTIRCKAAAGQTGGQRETGTVGCGRRRIIIPNKILCPLRLAGRARAFRSLRGFLEISFQRESSTLHEGWGLGRWDCCRGRRVGTRRAYLDRAGDEDDGGR